jgi:16S rRNA (cytosine967-C5)-methyltransferase
VIAPARRAALEVLVAVARGRRDLGEALDQARRGLDERRDIALLHELAIGTIRWQSRLDLAISALSTVALAKLDLEVLLVLRLGAYQLLYLSRVPPSAVVHDAVAQVRQARKSSAAGLTNAVLRRLANGEGRDLPARPTTPLAADTAAWVRYLAATQAHPAWLVTRWLARWPLDSVEAWLTFNNTTPDITLRLNPLLGVATAATLSALEAEGIVVTPTVHAPAGLRVVRGAVATSRAVADGACLMQDEGSQLAGLLAPVRPGDRVLDVCAAPGGKALIYAAAGAPGLVVACDARAARVALLAETLRRGRAPRARVVHLDPDAALPFAAAFDVVVVDAPCSGLGTLRRDPDIKWRRQPDDLTGFARRQVDLLTRAAATVRPGGRLVYTTCSTEPEENDEVVAAAVTRLADFDLVREPSSVPAVAALTGADGAFRTHPARDGLDGYYGVVLARRS